MYKHFLKADLETIAEMLKTSDLLAYQRICQVLDSWELYFPAEGKVA